MDPLHKIVFIVGAGHSGSTLLTKALNAHSEVFSLSEISNFEEDFIKNYSLCGCGLDLKDCPFWESINASLNAKLGFGIKDNPRAFNLRKERKNFVGKLRFFLERNLAVNYNIRSKHYRQRLRNIQELYATIFEHTGSKVLVDSSKSAKRAMLLKKYLKSNYEIKIIHLVRDGRAVFYSYSKGYYDLKLKNKKTGIVETKRFYSDRKRSKQEILNLWIKDNRAVYKYLDPDKNSGLNFIRYEDFVNNPELHLKEILQSMGLEYQPEMLDLNRYENHMVSGNASRINANSIHKPSLKWKEKLTTEELEFFNAKGKKLNEKFGYIM